MYILRITFQSFKKINNLKSKLLQLQKTQPHKIYKITQHKKMFTVLKSPHVNKKSREHFVYKNHCQKADFSFKTVFDLFNFLLLIKKVFSNNLNIKSKILKNKKCL